VTVELADGHRRDNEDVEQALCTAIEDMTDFEVSDTPVRSEHEEVCDV
jgi:hypothetical protein